MNKVTKNFLFGTALASTFVVTGAVDFTLGGTLDTKYGFRSGTLNLEGEKYDDKGLVYLATENTVSGNEVTVDSVTETGVASSALTAEALIHVDVKAGNKDLSYGITTDLEVNTSDNKYGSSAAAKRAFVYAKTKYGMISLGSMESCSAMLREKMIDEPYAGSGDSTYWIPEYVGKSTVTVGGTEIVDNIMPSVFFMLKPGLYGGNLGYTDEGDFLGATAPDRDTIYKKVYGNRISYKSPAWKGLKLGISYLPHARTGTISSIASATSSSTAAQKKRLKNLWDVSLSYKHELRNGVGFMGYLAYETGSMVDHELGFKTKYYNSPDTSGSGQARGDYSAATFIGESSASINFSAPRNLKASELGLSVNYKGFTLTGGAGTNGKELVGNIDVSTVKAEGVALKAIGDSALKSVELKAHNANTISTAPLITLKALDSSGKEIAAVFRRQDNSPAAILAAQVTNDALGFSDGVTVQHIALSYSAFDALASHIGDPGVSAGNTVLTSSDIVFTGDAGVVKLAADELASFAKDTAVDDTGLPNLHKFARGMDALVYLSKLQAAALVAGDGAFGNGGAAAPDADDSSERFTSVVKPAVDSILSNLKYDSTITAVEEGKHKAGGLLSVLDRVKTLSANSQDVYKAWHGSRNAAKYYHIGLHYKKGCFAASARYQNTERALFGATKANKMSKVELAASYKVAPGLLGYVEGSMYDLDYRTASSRYIDDPSKAKDQKNKVKTILIGGRLKF